jgi:inositol oxygenase
VCGETFPLGCRFAPQVASSQFFSVNPDRRRRALNTPCGIYEPGCGLQNVYMSWGGPDYLYLVLLLNQTTLPPEALFIIRYQKFAALTRSSAYHHLMSPEDRATLPLLSSFQDLSRCAPPSPPRPCPYAAGAC